MACIDCDNTPRCVPPASQNRIQTAPAAERQHTLILEWQWLRIPALLLILTGALGLQHGRGTAAAAWLGVINFPPVWGCWVMLAGGLIFAMIAATPSKRSGGPHPASKRTSWRSL